MDHQHISRPSNLRKAKGSSTTRPRQMPGTWISLDFYGFLSDTPCRHASPCQRVEDVTVPQEFLRLLRLMKTWCIDVWHRAKQCRWSTSGQESSWRREKSGPQGCSAAHLNFWIPHNFRVPKLSLTEVMNGKVDSSLQSVQRIVGQDKPMGKRFRFALIDKGCFLCAVWLHAGAWCTWMHISSTTGPLTWTNQSEGWSTSFEMPDIQFGDLPRCKIIEYFHMVPQREHKQIVVRQTERDVQRTFQACCDFKAGIETSTRCPNLSKQWRTFLFQAWPSWWKEQ